MITEITRELRSDSVASIVVTVLVLFYLDLGKWRHSAMTVYLKNSIDLSQRWRANWESVTICRPSLISIRIIEACEEFVTVKPPESKRGQTSGGFNI
jgi:hypothetical protein